MKLEKYKKQEASWPQQGKHIMAQYDDDSIIVYQAYRQAIALFAMDHQQFGGPFSLNRMSWIKPNFLWMMYRSGWAAKEGQEHVLAIRLRREGFDRILAAAVHSNFNARVYDSKEAWKAAGEAAEVRLQWDPDHAPNGAPVERRAIQLGLRGEMLRNYATDWILEIEDISAFVHEQAGFVKANRLDQLVTPAEQVYKPTDQAVVDRLELS